MRSTAVRGPASAVLGHRAAQLHHGDARQSDSTADPRHPPRALRAGQEKTRACGNLQSFLKIQNPTNRVDAAPNETDIAVIVLAYKPESEINCCKYFKMNA